MHRVARIHWRAGGPTGKITQVKPSPFAYSRPTTVDEALAVLADLGADGKVLAGGQSLVPLLSMRLAAPAHLVDINRLQDLDGVRVDGGGVTIRAITRQATVERHATAVAAVPLLGQALALVAHPVVRNRGTVVGSLAHADPSAELPAALALLGGTLTLASTSGRRTVAAADFYVGPLETVLRPEELVVEAFFPRSPERTGTAFVELARRHGDYAMCGVAALVTVDADGAVVSARAAYVSVAPTPLVLDLTDAVAGRDLVGTDWSPAGELARDQVRPDGDIHATAAYRRHLTGVLTVRALAEAAGRAVPAEAAA